jgi:peptidyl-prolyl cis-trans isomerase-like protein 2
MPIITEQEQFVYDEDEYMFKYIKTKGYAKISTNFGDLNFELYCNLAPYACYNFISLAKKKYYDGVKFHRLIKNFMVQGGDPSGTGRGGESIWKKDFKDEFNSTLKHSQRGVLSMANKGKDTNSSQFFITFAACSHLDNKHTVFGKVVGGFDVLTKIEEVETDQTSTPLKDVVIKCVSVFVDPYEDFKKKLAKRKLRAEQPEPEVKQEKRERDNGQTIGKYLQPQETVIDTNETIQISKKFKGKALNDFSSW